jgi:peptidoglycan/LPS O-acetylase OafA/YrhL
MIIGSAAPSQPGLVVVATATPSRLVEIDALRGVAAMAVVLFHLTTRYMELFSFKSPPSFSFVYGHFGVNLFFIISGFVIFMTLEKTARPFDFVVSRFSRLFPVYWVAIFVTFAITHWLGLPGKLVSIGSALANMLMLHGLFRVPHVDGVYWTLEVELLFYFGMFFLFRIRGLNRIHAVLMALLVIRLVYFVMKQAFGIELPWILFRLLILGYIPWFAIGISIYLATSRKGEGLWKAPACTAAMAIVTLLIAESIALGGLALAMAVVVYFAASGRLTWLRNPVLAWLGAISYPLYLVHENIGWSVQLRLVKMGVPTDLTVLIALVLVLALATLLNRLVEKPAMHWIRSRYRGRQAVLNRPR